jgi:ABC-2 type transport system permease protein
MSLKIFFALIERDLRVTLKHIGDITYRVAMLPFILTLVFGYILPGIGQVPKDFSNLMFSGILGASLVVGGIHGVAIALILDFGLTREIEEQLMAPINIKWVGVAKMITGIFESWLGGVIVLPIVWLLMSDSLSITISNVGLFIIIFVFAGLTSASLGLLLGTLFKPQQIAVMFPGVLIPIVLLGATFYSWEGLSLIPWVKVIVLLDPLIYVSESFRAVFTPQITHMDLGYSLLGLILSTTMMGFVGLRRFVRKAIV